VVGEAEEEGEEGGSRGRRKRPEGDPSGA